MRFRIPSSASSGASGSTRRSSCEARDVSAFIIVETGANQRPSKVLYDREGSAIALAKPGDIDFAKAFEGAGWFHITGITPAISQSAADLAMESVRVAREKGLTISCDLNYRKNLWKYGKTAKEVMSQLISFADVCIANEEDCQMALGIETDADVHSGTLEHEQYHKLTRQSSRRLPQSEDHRHYAARVEKRFE